ncbi:tyrosine-type recombinase/integrase, partial [bacterium]|nr:tyrosine-type recombinase/integrase [bacterium]
TIPAISIHQPQGEEARKLADVPPNRVPLCVGAEHSDEIIAVVSAFDEGGDPLCLRNAALTHLLYSSGIRVSECASLEIASLRLNERILRVAGKGNRQREVPFGRRAARALESYLERGRPAFAGQDSGDALWLNRRGVRLTARSMRRILDGAARRAGSMKRISQNKLRHACATHMLEGGADVRLIQEFLGHASLDTTQVYTQVTRARLREVYEQSHPRARRKQG